MPSAFSSVFSLQSSVIRFFLVGLLILVSGFVFASSSFAQTEESETTDTSTGVINSGVVITPGKDPEAPKAENWNAFNQSGFTMNTLVNSASCMISGLPFGGDGCVQTAFTLNQQTQSMVPTTIITYNGEGGGVMGSGAKFMAMMYNNQPASSIEYTASIFHEGFGIGEPAYAQVSGSGAAVISPVQKLWQVFRNIAYLFFILIFVAVGVMIMFRQKLNPQTVISVQNALPGLVVALILVTFSFFLSGLIIDLAFLGTQLLGIIFLSQVGGVTDIGAAAGHVTELLNTQNVINMFVNIVFNGDLWSQANIAGTSFSELIFQRSTNGTVMGIIGALAACLNPIGLALVGGTGPIGAVACAGTGWLISSQSGFIVSALMFIILLIGLVQALIRLFFALVTSYVIIVLTTIFSPLIILFSAVPGNGNVLGMWWKSLLGNVLVFPAVFGLFLIVASIIGLGEPWFLNSTVTTFEQALPLFGGAPMGFVQVLLVYGLLLMSSGLPDFVKELVGAKPNQILQAAIKSNMGTGTQAAGVVGPTLGRAGYKFIGGGLEAGFWGSRAGELLKRGGFGPNTQPKKN